MASTVTELMMRRMGAKSGSAIDWESIARGMVDGATEFELIDFPASSTSNYRFYQRVGLKSVVMDNTITSIGERCFGGCTNLESIVISSALTSVGFGAFDGCNALKNITIPSSATSIGNYVFNNCTGLTMATIGNSVTSIGVYAFNNCRGLVSVILEPTTPPTISSGTWNNTTCNFYVPDSAVNDYKAASQWSNFASRIFPISDLTT